jgi:hypothetical protein
MSGVAAPAVAVGPVFAKPGCRACNSPDVRFSYPRFHDYLLARFRHFEVFRCRSCQHRFRVYLIR